MCEIFVFDILRPKHQIASFAGKVGPDSGLCRHPPHAHTAIRARGPLLSFPELWRTDRKMPERLGLIPCWFGNFHSKVFFGRSKNISKSNGLSAQLRWLVHLLIKSTEILKEWWQSPIRTRFLLRREILGITFVYLNTKPPNPHL